MTDTTAIVPKLIIMVDTTAVSDTRPPAHSGVNRFGRRTPAPQSHAHTQAVPGSGGSAGWENFCPETPTDRRTVPAQASARGKRAITTTFLDDVVRGRHFKFRADTAQPTTAIRLTIICTSAVDIIIQAMLPLCGSGESAMAELYSLEADVNLSRRSWTHTVNLSTDRGDDSRQALA